MAQLRRGRLRMVVYVVGSCWWCDLAVCSGSPHSHAALSASPHLFVDALYRPTAVRSLFRVVQCFRLRYSPLTPSPWSDTWRCTRWVRMLPTPASTLPQSMHPSTGPRGWHLALAEPPCCKVYGTWVCLEVLHSLWCRAVCACRVSLLSVPRRGWLFSALGRQGLTQRAETQ